MNAEHVEQLKARLRANVEYYDQTTYGPRDHTEDPKNGVCQTPCCIAGHLFCMARPTASLWDALIRNYDAEDSVITVAANYLGLDLDDWRITVLFGTGLRWPEPYRIDMAVWGNQTAMVERACGFLDWLLLSGVTYNEYYANSDREYDRV